MQSIENCKTLLWNDFIDFSQILNRTTVNAIWQMQKVLVRYLNIFGNSRGDNLEKFLIRKKSVPDTAVIVDYARRWREGTFLMSVSFQYSSSASTTHSPATRTENSHSSMKSLSPEVHTLFFYNTCVISDVFWGSQIVWGSWMRK